MSQKNRGAPKGNHNALKHGFYSTRPKSSSSPAQDDPATLDLSAEIALLRRCIARVVDLTPPEETLDSARETLRLLCLASTAISRLVRAHYLVQGSEDDQVREEMGRIADEVRLELEARARQGISFMDNSFSPPDSAASASPRPPRVGARGGVDPSLPNPHSAGLGPESDLDPEAASNPATNSGHDLLLPAPASLSAAKKPYKRHTHPAENSAADGPFLPPRVGETAPAGLSGQRITLPDPEPIPNPGPLPRMDFTYGKPSRHDW